MAEIKKLRQHFNILLQTVGISNSKADILAGYGVESTTELSEQQLVELIDRLRLMEHNKENAPKIIRTERSIVLNLLTKLGIYEDSGSWTRVNVFLLDKRIAGKLLYEMNELELQKLQHKLRAIINKSKNESINEYKAQDN
jgi:hypothetical protein